MRLVYFRGQDAHDVGLAGVVLSHYGSRQLDCSRSGIEVLSEVVSKCEGFLFLMTGFNSS
jgi:isopentenyl diphosphate isomerase/L-lactate dehydrogenase-like FMN-dependent dehydrogenase